MKIENLEKAYTLKTEIEIRENWLEKLKSRSGIEFTLEGRSIPLSADARECLENEIYADIEEDIRQMRARLQYLLDEK